MTRNRELRKILEPEAPRLSAGASARLDAAVESALARGSRRPRRIPRAALVAAPALVAILLAVLWLRPGGEGPDYLLLSEEEFLAALENWENPTEVYEALYSTDLGDYDDTETWNDTDWDAFRQDLEGFQMADNGGES